LADLTRLDQKQIFRFNGTMKNEANIYEAKSQFSKLIAKVEETGEPYVICRNGKPVVDLVLHRQARDPLNSDPELRGARFIGDPVVGLSEEDWPEELR
jgi:antitoxin (DNA-binding transcriptional repressor) of toxin-antitoxin stability system